MASGSKSKKKVINKALVIVIIIAVLFIGYQRLNQTDEVKVAATVNGVQIMKEDVVKEYLRIPPEYRDVMTAENILEGMIINEIMLQEASEKGISVSDSEVDSYLSELLAAAGKTEEELLEEMEDMGYTMEELRDSLKRELTIAELLNATVLGEITVEESEARDYYDSHISEFTTPEMIRASHILVNTSKEAASIRNKALGGAKFDELAEEYSLCPSSAQGGDLGWFGKGGMVKEFEDAAFALEDTGDISPVVETQFGFHVIKLAGRQEEGTEDYEDVKNSIMQMILMQKQSAAVEIYTSQLRAASDVEILMKLQNKSGGKSINDIIKAQQAEKAAAEAAAKEAAETEATGAASAGKNTADSGETVTAETLAQCLTSKGARMFGSGTSSISEEQKEMFGDDFSDIDYIDCDTEKDACSENRIISYPTWIINGKKHPGKYSLQRLAELSGC